MIRNPNPSLACSPAPAAAAAAATAGSASERRRDSLCKPIPDEAADVRPGWPAASAAARLAAVSLPAAGIGLLAVWALAGG